jgi:predicted nuclease with TOPRIM domain
MLEMLSRTKSAAETSATVEPKVAEPAARIEQLERSLVERSAELERAAAESAALRRRVGELEDDLEAAARRAAEEAFDERIVLVEELAALRTRVEIQDDLRVEGHELRTQLIDASRSVGEAYALRLAVERAQESLATMRESLRERVTASEAETARLRLAASTASLEAEAVRSALDELRRDYDALQEAGRRTEAERDELAGRVAELEDEAQKRERAVAETVADLRRAIAHRESELTLAGERRAAAVASGGLSAGVLDLTSRPASGSLPAAAGSVRLAMPVPVTVPVPGAPPLPDIVLRLDAELQRTQAVHRLTVDSFARHIDDEIAMLRAELAEIDRLIQTTQNGRVWTWRAKLGRVKQILRRGLRRA